MPSEPVQASRHRAPLGRASRVGFHQFPLGDMSSFQPIVRPRQDMSSGHARLRGTCPVFRSGDEHKGRMSTGPGQQRACPVVTRGGDGHVQFLGNFAGRGRTCPVVTSGRGGHIQSSGPGMGVKRARGWAQGEYVHWRGAAGDMSRGLTGEQEQRQQHGKPPKPPRPHGPVPPPPPAWLPDLRPR